MFTPIETVAALAWGRPGAPLPPGGWKIRLEGGVVLLGRKGQKGCALVRLSDGYVDGYLYPSTYPAEISQMIEQGLRRPLPEDCEGFLYQPFPEDCEGWAQEAIRLLE